MEAETQVLGDNRQAHRRLLNPSISSQSLTPGKGEGGVSAQRRHGPEHVPRSGIDPE